MEMGLRTIKRVWSGLDGSVRVRIFIPCAVLFAIVLLAGPVLVVQMHGTELEESLARRLELFSQLAADGLVASMAHNADGSMPDILGNMNEQSGERLSVSLIAPDGKVAFSSQESLIGTLPWKDLPGDRTTIGRLPGGQLVALRPIFNEQRCAECHGAAAHITGWLEARISTTQIALAKENLARKMALAAVASLLALLAISWWLIGREVVGPLRRLVGAMKRAAAGENDVVADEGRPDELGEAARRFDSTLAALNRSTKELEAVYAQKLERADRFAVVGEMATGLAHEIKNPLAGLSGALELLSEDLAHSPMQAEVVTEMQHQVQRLSTTMEGLLRFARPPRARMRSMDVNASINNVLFLVEQQRSGGPVEVVRNLSPDLPTVQGDPGQIEQVLLNLCLNARQSMAPKGGVLTVSSFVRDGQLIVQVADNGPGIPLEARAHIFTPFFTTRNDGNGLGLAISARIVLEHAGQISFKCPPQGGTVFTVSFPIEAVGRQAA